MNDQYAFLPGVLSEFRDGGLVLRNTEPASSTQSVLILGTSMDGPELEAVAVDATTYAALYGKSTTSGVPNGATLVDAFEAAHKLGARDIRLMRISGTRAAADLTLPAVNETYEAVTDVSIGTKTGNAATPFVLANTPVVGTVKVFANGVQISSTAFTVNTTTKTVALKANTVDADAAISIKYDWDNAGVNTTTTDSGSGTPFKATGTDQVFTLAKTPKTDSLTVFADGIELAATKFTLVATSLTVKKDATSVGAKLTASFAYDVTDARTPVVKATGVFAGSIYNQVALTVETIKDTDGVTVIGKRLKITKPVAKTLTIGEVALTYDSTKYATVGQLVAAVNGDANNNVVKLSASTDDELLDTGSLNLVLNVALTGGTDGVKLSKTEKYNALQKAYELLENYTVDAIVVSSATADETVPGKAHDMPYAYQLALGCAVISHRNRRVHGYIATSSPTEAGLAAVEAHVTKLEGLSMNFRMLDKVGSVITDADGHAIDLGGYICVLAGPDVVINTVNRGPHAVNAAAALAGFVSALAPQSAPTNKVLADAKGNLLVGGLRFSFGMPQANRLAAKRYITLTNQAVDAGRSSVVAIVDGPTAALPGSDWTRVSTVRGVGVCVDDMKDAARPFLGEPTSLNNRNALSAAVAKRLDARKQGGVIADYSFQMVATPADLVMGQLSIDAEFVPAGELRKVKLSVALQPGS